MYSIQYNHSNSIQKIIYFLFFIQKVPIPGGRIVKIFCGRNQTACITADNEVFTWGDSSFAQLGHGFFFRFIFPLHSSIITLLIMKTWEPITQT